MLRERDRKAALPDPRRTGQRYQAIAFQQIRELGQVAFATDEAANKGGSGAFRESRIWSHCS